MNAFMYLILFFTTIVSFVTQITAAPIPSVTIAQLDEIPIQRANNPFLPHNPEHGSKYANVITTIITPARATSMPSSAPIHEQAGRGTEGGANKSWAETHPAALIVLFTLLPFVACIALYPVFRWFLLRRAARLAKRAAKSEEKVKPPDNPTSPYLNNPRLEPLPAHPQMVYVPPMAKDGTQSIFGHFRSPSGHVYGVTDRWVMAKGGIVYGADPDRSSDSQSLFVYPV